MFDMVYDYGPFQLAHALHYGYTFRIGNPTLRANMGELINHSGSQTLIFGG